MSARSGPREGQVELVALKTVDPDEQLPAGTQGGVRGLDDGLWPRDVVQDTEGDHQVEGSERGDALARQLVTGDALRLIGKALGQDLEGA